MLKKINNHFTDNRETQSLWQAIQTITDYKFPPQACDQRRTKMKWGPQAKLIDEASLKYYFVNIFVT